VSVVGIFLIVKSLFSLATSWSRDRQVSVSDVYFVSRSVRVCVLREVGRKYSGVAGEPVGWIVDEEEMVREKVGVEMCGLKDDWLDML